MDSSGVSRPEAKRRPCSLSAEDDVTLHNRIVINGAGSPGVRPKAGNEGRRQCLCSCNVRLAHLYS